MLDLLWAVAALLLILWAVGQFTHFTMGGFIHGLLVVAAVAVLFRIILGRRAV